MTRTLVAAALRPEELLDHERRGFAWLTPLEQRRWAALATPGLRAQFLAAHLLARACAAVLTGGAPRSQELRQSCPGCGADDHGRPRLHGRPDVHVTLAHTDDMVAAAAAFEPCGVDVERDRPLAPPVAAKFLTPGERASVAAGGPPAMTYWRRKEALAKARAGELPELLRLDTSRSDAGALWAGEGDEGRWYALWERDVGGVPVCLVSTDRAAACDWLDARDARAALMGRLTDAPAP